MGALSDFVAGTVGYCRLCRKGRARNADAQEDDAMISLLNAYAAVYRIAMFQLPAGKKVKRAHIIFSDK
jgi:hypothetical protein